MSRLPWALEVLVAAGRYWNAIGLVLLSRAGGESDTTIGGMLRRVRVGAVSHGFSLMDRDLRPASVRISPRTGPRSGRRTAASRGRLPNQAAPTAHGGAVTRIVVPTVAESVAAIVGTQPNNIQRMLVPT